MPRRENPKGQRKLKQKVYTLMLRYPGKTDAEIAHDLDTTSHMVSKQRSRIINGIDFLLAKHMAESFLQDYQMSIDAMKIQLGELEDEIGNIRKDIAEGWKEEEKPLDTLDKAALRRDILAIQKQKTDIWMKIVTQARQSEAIEIMNLIKKKVIKMPDVEGVVRELDTK